MEPNTSFPIKVAHHLPRLVRSRLVTMLALISCTAACQLPGKSDFQPAYVNELSASALVQMQSLLATELGVTRVNLNPDQFAQCTTVTLEPRQSSTQTAPAEVFELGIANYRCILRRTSTGKELPLSDVSCSTTAPPIAPSNLDQSYQ